MESLWQDLWYGARMLRKHGGFTAIAILTVALGIGVNTAIFSMVDGFVLRPLPVSHPEQLTTITAQQNGHYSNAFSYPDFQDIRNQTADVYSDVAAFDFGQDGLTIDGKTQPMLSGYVSGNFFRMAAIKPALGRFILPSEGNVAGADPVIVLAYTTWKTRFGGDPNIVGKRGAVNGQPVTIIGVTPQGFRGPAAMLDIQAYLPIAMQTQRLDASQSADFMTDRSSRSMIVLGRLQDGVTLKQARAELDVVASRLSQRYPATNKGLLLHTWKLGPEGPSSNPAANPIVAVSALFLGLAFVVLVLACVNIANMLLVRAAARGREMAVRAALGAARSRLIRQLLAESVLLAALGGAAGVGIGLVASRAISSLRLSTSFPFVMDFHFDWRVFSYAFAMALLTGILAGVVPAIRASRTDLIATLHSNDRATTSSRQRMRGVLVTLQVAGSLALMVIAGLFARSLGNAHMADLGFDPQHVLNLTMDPHDIGYNDAQSRQFYDQLLARMSSLPGVQSAALAATIPMGEIENGGPVEVEGHPVPHGQTLPSAGANYVSPDYLDVMRIPLLEGRKFTAADEANSLPVAIINEEMAHRFWPNENPIGRRFTAKEDPKHTLEIIGIVKNSKTDNIAAPVDPYYYTPLKQHFTAIATLQVRAKGSAESVAQETQELIRSLAPTMPVYGIETMSEALQGINGLLLFRLGAGLAASLGLLGLVLATVGVYGVVSYSAGQRTREIGIRMALGAQRGQVLRMVCRQGMYIIGIGLAVGFVAALAIGSVAGSFLVGVSGTDPLTFVTVTGALLLIGLAACFIPARRAASVDPMIALRHE